jgi:hypothetical protein
MISYSVKRYEKRQSLPFKPPITGLLRVFPVRSAAHSGKREPLAK